MTQGAQEVPGGSLEPPLPPGSGRGPGRVAPVMLSAPNAINGHKIIHSFLEAGPTVCLNGTIKLHAEMIWKRRGQPGRAEVK